MAEAPASIADLDRLDNTVMEDQLVEFADKTAKVEGRKKFPVVELFGPTIQGEGKMIGTVSHFVRFGGCTYRCSWCDSLHAVLPSEVKKNSTWMSAGEITQKLLSMSEASRPWVTLSGGDPCMWDLYELVMDLNAFMFKTAIETQGAIYHPWLRMVDQVTISPKPPSSGMQDKINHGTLLKILTVSRHAIFKVVVFTQEDLLWAAQLHKLYPCVPFYLSIGTHPDPKGAWSHMQIRMGICEKMRSTVEEMLSMPEFHDCIILPQLHVLLWAHSKGV